MISSVNDEADVMLVEDDPDSRTDLAELLELQGYKVVAFANGAEALDHLVQFSPPRLIVTDLRMPVMDGSRFRSALLRDAELAKIPVIVVTAFAPPAATSLSALRVLRKPLDLKALFTTIRENC
jgi:CheY-like chemotaxis protein